MPCVTHKQEIYMHVDTPHTHTHTDTVRNTTYLHWKCLLPNYPSKNKADKFLVRIKLLIAPCTDGVTVLGKGTTVESTTCFQTSNSYIKFIHVFGRFSPGPQLRIDREMIQGSTHECITCVRCKVHHLSPNFIYSYIPIIYYITCACMQGDSFWESDQARIQYILTRGKKKNHRKFKN